MSLKTISLSLKAIYFIFVHSSPGENGLSNQYFEEDRDDEKHDLVAYITHPGASGYAYTKQLCMLNSYAPRYSMNKAYGKWECGKYSPPEPMDCTPTNRLALTAEVVYIRSNYIITICMQNIEVNKIT